MSSGHKLANEYISGQRPYPEAVMCANDYMAHGLLDEFAEKNIDISKYFAVTGSIGISPLTSTHPPIFQHRLVRTST